MVIPLGDGSFINVAHISLLSGVQAAPGGPGTHQLPILLMGRHWHVHHGSKEVLERLHARLKDGIDQLEAAAGR